MNVIKTILQSLDCTPEDIFMKKGVKRENDRITKARQLINFCLYTMYGYNSKSIERRLSPLSDGFNHATVLYSCKVIKGQLYHYLPELDKIIPNLNKAS